MTDDKIEKKYIFLDDREKLKIETHIGVFTLCKTGETIQFPEEFGEKTYLPKEFTRKRGIYCLVERENILYVGKSDEPLRNRIATYLNPGKKQETNKRIKKNLLSRSIDIFFMSENDLKKMKDLLKICSKMNENKGLKKEITINRCAEMVITGYCFGETFLNK